MRESAERRLSTVRENAIAAAQVAQDVLAAAAIEDSDAPLPPTENDDSGWQNWPSQSNEPSSPLPPPEAPAQPSVPLHTAPPPPPMNNDGTPFSRLPPKRPARAPRYVVTGLETSAAPKLPFITPPRPHFNVSSAPPDSSIPPLTETSSTPHGQSSDARDSTLPHLPAPFVPSALPKQLSPSKTLVSPQSTLEQPSQSLPFIPLSSYSSPENLISSEQSKLPETLFSQEHSDLPEQKTQPEGAFPPVEPVPPSQIALAAPTFPYNGYSGFDSQAGLNSAGNGNVSHESLDGRPVTSETYLTGYSDELGSANNDDHADAQRFTEHKSQETKLQNSKDASHNSNNAGLPLDWRGFDQHSSNIQQQVEITDFGFPSEEWAEDRITDDGSSFFGVGELQHNQIIEASNPELVQASNANGQRGANSEFVVPQGTDRSASNTSTEFLPLKPNGTEIVAIPDKKETVMSNQNAESANIDVEVDNVIVDHETQIVNHNERNIVLDGAEVRNEGYLTNPQPSSNESAVVKQSTEIKLLEKKLQAVRSEIDSTCAVKEELEHNYDSVRREVMVLRDEVADCKDDMHLAFAERDRAKETMKQMQAEMEQLLLERDNAIAKSKDAPDVLLASPSRQPAVEDHEKLADELHSIREHQRQVEDERDKARREIELLLSRHNTDIESFDSQLSEKENKLKTALEKITALQKERDDAMATRLELIEEQRNLFDDVQARVAEVNEKETELSEIQKKLRDSTADNQQDKIQLEAVAKQLAELKEAMESAVSERNTLYTERQNLAQELDKVRSELSSTTMSVTEANRKLSSVAKEAQDVETKSKNLQAELDDVRDKCETIRKERDALVHQRTLSLDEANIPQSMKDLSDECETKTREIAGLHRQLKSASAKVTKLTAQRNTILRQRDDAGARLSSAGVEFSTMSNKLKRLTSLNTEASSQVCKLQEERDDARQKISELAASASRADALEEAALENRRQLHQVEDELAAADQSRLRAEEAYEAIQNELHLTKTEVKRISDLLTAAVREKEASKEECESLKTAESVLRNALKEEKETVLEVKAAFTRIQSEMNLTVERMEDEKKSLLAELSTERASIASTTAELEAVCTSLQQKEEALSLVKNELEASLRHGENAFKAISLSEGLDLELSSIHDSELLTEYSTESDTAIAQAFGKVHENVCYNLTEVVHKLNTIFSDCQEMRMNSAEDSGKIQTLEERINSLNRHLSSAQEECVQLQSSRQSSQQLIEDDKKMISMLQSEKLALIQDIESSKTLIHKLQDDLEAMGMTLAAERSSRDAFSLDEKKQLEDQIAMATTQIDSLWALTQQSLRPEDAQNIIEEGERNGEDGSMSSVGIMVMQGFRALSEELRHMRSLSSEYDEKLAAAQREIDLIWERTELAETERDSARAARDRWERDAKSAKEKAFAEAAAQADLQISQLRQQFDNAREDILILQDSLEKSETESINLRSSCDKLTANTNLKSRQLDDAEERLAYLQDEVATLREDLEYAQERAQSGEQQSGEAHRIELERISSELDASREHAAGLEEQVMMLRDEAEKLKNSQVETQLIMETHKTAEQNLQIAIEQLEAEQESLIERKTMELKRRLEDASETAEAARAMMDEAGVVKNQLTLRDEEIAELRTALGRLADERVELKLELEKSLTRLRHSSGGEQLVDRRYIRQLLVNYFRVGMARRRDVLELISRMLGFSEDDLVAVGLKRVALTERIGSLLQPPELDGNSLAPLGTVTDKWIEFLMKETEEEEEDF